MTLTTRENTSPALILQLWKSQEGVNGQVQVGDQALPGILKAYHTFHSVLSWGKRSPCEREGKKIKKCTSTIAWFCLYNKDQKSFWGRVQNMFLNFIFFNCFALIFSDLNPNLWYLFVLCLMGLIKLVIDILKINFTFTYLKSQFLLC